MQEFFFLPLCLFFYVIATNTEAGWLYVLLAVLAGLLVTGWIGPRLTVRGLIARREVLGDPQAGDTVVMRLSITNPGPRTRWYLTVRDVAPAGLQPERGDYRMGIDRLAPGESAAVEYDLDCPRRGRFNLGAVSVVSATPLGLFPAYARCAAPGTLVVWPVGPHVARLPVHTAVPSTVVPHHVNTVLGHSHDLAGIREYRAGEDVRFIHWPSTARAGDLMIKEFHDISSQSIAILLDAHRDSQSLVEQMVSGATSLCTAAHRHNMPITLIVGREVLRHPRAPQALSALAAVEADGALSPQDLIRTAAPAVPARVHLFLVTARPDWEAADLAPLHDRRAWVSVLLFRASGERLRAAGLNVYEVDDVENLPEVLAHG
ncbi:MAG TPA: DUF58 domain-containing protein [Candidatus Xenobia bacterium]